MAPKKRSAAKLRPDTAQEVSARSTPLSARVRSWIDRRAAWLAWALILLATLRIAATYTVYSHTSDEPAHLACGMEWLRKSSYTLEAQHPPLARVMAALGPYLDGTPFYGRDWMYTEGVDELYRQGRYWRTLTLARLGILPFFWLTCLAVYLWARRAWGNVEAVLALFLLTFTPPVLAHAGLATTDMALTCGITWSFLALLVWVQEPTLNRSLLLAAAVAAGVLSKFSMLAFFPASLSFLAAFWWLYLRPYASLGAAARWPRYGLMLLISATACLLLIWAGYRFSTGAVGSAGLWAPAPELLRGIGQVLAHQRQGHPSYLLGDYSEHGFLLYYPVILAIKTPLPLLGLFVAGVWMAFRRRQEVAMRSALIPAALAAGILAFALTSNINIGVRHVLPLYPLMALVAAPAAAFLTKSAAGTWRVRAFWVLAAWLVAGNVLAHPDYLPYFNEIAVRHPEQWAADSDLDWGQDMQRLADKLRAEGAREVVFEPFVYGVWQYHGFPPLRKMDVERPLPGWNAVSLTNLKVTRFGIQNPEARKVQLWPEVIPPHFKIGKGIWLWYFPPQR